jgi:hypothetical protein
MGIGTVVVTPKGKVIQDPISDPHEDGFESASRHCRAAEDFTKRLKLYWEDQARLVVVGRVLDFLRERLAQRHQCHLAALD